MEATGYVPVEEVVLVREGDKDRQLVLTLSPALDGAKPTASASPVVSPAVPPAAGTGAPAFASSARRTDGASPPVPVASYVTAAVGVAALGVAGIFDIKATEVRAPAALGAGAVGSAASPIGSAPYHTAKRQALDTFDRDHCRALLAEVGGSAPPRRRTRGDLAADVSSLLQKHGLTRDV